MQASSGRGDEPMDRRGMLQSAALSALGAMFVTSASPAQTWAANVDFDKVCVALDLCAYLSVVQTVEDFVLDGAAEDQTFFHAPTTVANCENLRC